jgi:hypothetical protein
LPLKVGDAVPLSQDEVDQILAAAAVEVEHGAAACPIPARLSLRLLNGEQLREFGVC